MKPTARLLILGAHPDDAEFHAGGLSLAYRARGNAVKWVSVTDGSAGHHQLTGHHLVERRRGEATASAASADVECEVWRFRDGYLMPELKLREAIIREIRAFRPDLVLTHRPWDYHPDHRALGQAVQDACYLVTVPGILPGTTPLQPDPVVAYMADPFQKPIPFEPHCLLDVTSSIDAIVGLLGNHESQFYEFLPLSFGAPEPVPTNPAERLAWLRKWFLERTRWRTERWGAALDGIRAEEALVEAFEIAEYARQPDHDLLLRLFPGAVLPNLE